ncbi:hypothetical protein FHW69_003471 [Luteibacter sp. Sphag1AF]|uniref:hypothetical protein n=1 Tax=Luteibacter sp. Sphag1AF TaxID=2587031 RepID=UPI001620F390|nr:hypothetical protein [Luteibacter sp. Sphag1AF]MBB3228826.1 hypothetical protein [Luteibacter sp. Sphag1AF]
MNALVGQEAKANFSLFWRFCDDGSDDGQKVFVRDDAIEGIARSLTLEIIEI